MLTGDIETFDLVGQEKVFTFSFSNCFNIRDHITEVLSGSAYPLPTKDQVDPTLIIDVGANIGASVIFFRNRFPNTPILCYEPAAENLAFLRLNLKQAEPVEIVPYGLSNRDGTARLYHGQYYGLQNSIHQSIETDPSRYEDIKIVDASRELASRIIPGTLLKIDTEGCEVEIIEAISGKLDELLLIFLEFHSEKARRELDLLLKNTHTLFSGKVTDPHRGTFGYIHTNTLNRFPKLNRLEIKN